MEEISVPCQQGANPDFELLHNFLKIGVQKKKDYDCGQRCVSIITGFPLEMIFPLCGRKGTRDTELAAILHRCGWQSDWFARRFLWSGGSLAGFPELCIVGTRGHWMVLKGNVLYCPSFGIMKLVDSGVKIKCLMKILDKKILTGVNK